MHMIENGNVAAALGVKLAGAQVIAAYPITPQTPLTEKLSEYIEAGEMKAQYVPVESEHSAMAACIAASSTGARAFTATSANGLLYMHEQIHWAAGARLPIVMCVVNRAVGAPWCIWNDHQDSMSQRDTGWIQMYCCDHQQIIDTVIKAFSIAEAVSVPVMVCYDGYLLSHTYMPFEVPEEEKVARFLKPFKPAYALDPENPANLNTVTLPDVRMDVGGEMAHGYMEIRRLLQEDLRSVLTVAQETEDNFGEIFGRGGDALLEPYRCDDAEYIVVGLGSLTYQLRDVVEVLREEGHKCGRAGCAPLPALPRSGHSPGSAGRARRYRHRKGGLLRLRGSALLRSQGGPLRAPRRQEPCPRRQGPRRRHRGTRHQDRRSDRHLRAAITGTLDDSPDWIGLKL